MKNKTIKNYGLLCATFALAVAGTGCSTTQIATHNEQDCMIGQKTTGQLLLVFVASADAGTHYSKSCHEGKVAASTTLIGRNEQGQLSRGGAVFALEFQKLVTEKINTGTEMVSKFNQEVEYYFKFYLKNMAGLTLDDIRKYVDQLESTPPQPQDDTKPMPQKESKCPVQGSIRACGSNHL